MEWSIRGENVKELIESSIELTGTVNALVEEEAEVGGVLTMVKVGRDEAGQGIRSSMAKSLIYALSVGLENLWNKQLVWILISIYMFNLHLDFVMVVVVVVDVVGVKNMNLRPHLIVGIGLDSVRVFLSKIGGRLNACTWGTLCWIPCHHQNKKNKNKINYVSVK